ncbi:V(D)J recombination-activating protein 1-like [Amphiura filiformis]|uniref:V(D)J recombination-activating protein 1-like n=1 Tax=Amphiura filiformis TaxID=82378 RepID=UPI003B20DE88
MMTITCPTMEIHTRSLGKLCRICGYHLPNAKKLSLSQSQVSKPATYYAEDIKFAFAIDINLDEKDIHPTHVCRKCIRKLHHAKADENLHRKYLGDTKVPWSHHPRSTNGPCFVCDKMEKARRGGISRRPAPPHLTNRLPFVLKEDNIFQDLIAKESNHTALSTNDPAQLATDDPNIRTHFTCSICLHILSNPISTPCNHHFCSLCMSKLFQIKRSSTVNCPSCEDTIKFDDVRAISYTFQLHFENLKIQCSKCKATVPLRTSHNCQQPSPTTFAASIMTKLALDHHTEEPVPDKVAEAVGAWVDIMTKKKGTVELKSKPSAKKNPTGSI